MLTAFGPTPLGVVSPPAAAAAAGSTLSGYALVTPGVVLNAATATRVTDPTP